MNMPEDFYQLLDFCKSINNSDPKSKQNQIQKFNDFCFISNRCLKRYWDRAYWDI